MNAEKLDAVFISRPATIVIIEMNRPPPPIPPALEIEAAKNERTAAIIVEMENSIVDWLKFVEKLSHWVVVLRNWSTVEKTEVSIVVSDTAMADGLKMMKIVVMRERSTWTRLILIF